jgi:siroheme synthase-like protein
MAFDYPVFLSLDGVSVLVVGAGRVAERKVAGLVAAGARVTVVAPRVTAAVSAAVAGCAGVVLERGFAPGDCTGHRLVIAATDDPVVNAAVAAEATAAGIWVNSADDPANCTFALPAIARSGPVVVAVGTGGASPALASHLRDRIASEVLDERVERAAAELARQRAEIHAAGGSTEAIEWAARVAEALGPRIRG